ncbi:MAG: DUF3147 domain-containing protein [Nitrospirota bacterium]|nr:DUF3147 domain-containing protein [Nitrospirota bacterium]MDH5768726.1 DUF3147 domain-containing protein [Nitrospirota bacterium]
MELKYVLYFLVGGAIVSIVTYFASHARGLLAAFIANLPVITVITFLTVYFESGEKAVVPYAEGLVIMLIPWLAYIFAIIFLTHRLGFIPSLVMGMALYFLIAFIIMSIKKF